MNILISTTSNWNPGDDIIRYGVQYLLESHFGPDINYIWYNRNPDYFKVGTNEMGSNHKSNGYTSPINWTAIDLVVLAGSPEWLHGPLRPVYEGLVENPNIPMIAIGVGYSFGMGALASLTEAEVMVLKRPSTKIITRQYDLAEKISGLLGREVMTLPCPGVFSSKRFNFGAPWNAAKAVIRQSHRGHQGLRERDVKQTELAITSEYSVISHYIKDFEDFGGYFTSDSVDLVGRIVKYATIISNRLHGGLCALGNGSKVQFINSDNRVQRALEPFAPYKADSTWYSMTEIDMEMLKQNYLKELSRI